MNTFAVNWSPVSVAIPAMARAVLPHAVPFAQALVFKGTQLRPLSPWSGGYPPPRAAQSTMPDPVRRAASGNAGPHDKRTPARTPQTWCDVPRVEEFYMRFNIQ